MGSIISVIILPRIVVVNSTRMASPISGAIFKSIANRPLGVTRIARSPVAKRSFSVTTKSVLVIGAGSPSRSGRIVRKLNDVPPAHSRRVHAMVHPSLALIQSAMVAAWVAENTVNRSPVVAIASHIDDPLFIFPLASTPHHHTVV